MRPLSEPNACARAVSAKIIPAQLDDGEALLKIRHSAADPAMLADTVLADHTTAAALDLAMPATWPFLRNTTFFSQISSHNTQIDITWFTSSPITTKHSQKLMHDINRTVSRRDRQFGCAKAWIVIVAVTLFAIRRTRQCGSDLVVCSILVVWSILESVRLLLVFLFVEIRHEIQHQTWWNVQHHVRDHNALRNKYEHQNTWNERTCNTLGMIWIGNSDRMLSTLALYFSSPCLMAKLTYSARLYTPEFRYAVSSTTLDLSLSIDWNTVKHQYKRSDKPSSPLCPRAHDQESSCLAATIG